jgi:hypothetical protein
MTTKTISGTITGGYTLSADYSALSVTATGLIKGGKGGVGVAGVTLPIGGEVDNSGRVSGGSGAYQLRTPGGSGGVGVTLAATGAVYNQGGITGGAGGPSTYVLGGAGGAGVALAETGAVENLGAVDGGVGGRSFYGTGGVGGVGVAIGDGGTVGNSGTITGGAGGLGSLYGGAGGAGVTLGGGGTVDNTGTITGGRAGRALSGGGSTPGPGIELAVGGSVTNGSASAGAALIAGGVGFHAGATGAATLTNYGVIQGTAGVSVQFGTSSDRLIAEAGSTWMGSVAGGDGTLELASGTGTINGLGATGTIGGAEAMTFSGFATYELDAATQWILAGADTLATGSTLIDDGALTIAGKLTDRGAIDGAGRLSIGAGATLEANSTVSATLSVAFEGNAGTLALAKPKMFDATISGFAAADTIDLEGLQADRAKVNGRDMLEIFEGSARVALLQLSGTYAGATFALGSDGHGGTDIRLQSPAPPEASGPAATPHALIAAMASLGGARAAAAEIHAASVDIPRQMLLSARPALA